MDQIIHQWFHLDLVIQNNELSGKIVSLNPCLDFVAAFQGRDIRSDSMITGGVNINPTPDPKDLEVEITFHKSSYAMQIKIPAHTLHGFDPIAFDRLGFTYRIHRFKGSAQYFSSSGEHFSLEQHPRFWASFTFSK